MNFEDVKVGDRLKHIGNNTPYLILAIGESSLFFRTDTKNPYEGILFQTELAGMEKVKTEEEKFVEEYEKLCVKKGYLCSENKAITLFKAGFRFIGEQE